MSRVSYKCNDCGKSFQSSSDSIPEECPYCKSNNIRRIPTGANASQRPLKSSESINKKIIVLLIVVVLAVAVFLVILNWKSIDKHMHPSEVQLPASEEELTNLDCEDVKSILKRAGLKSINTKADKDLEDDNGFPAAVGEVEAVTIDGKSDYKKGDWVDPESRIVITYHDLKASVPTSAPTAEPTTSPTDIKVSISSKDMKGQQYSEIQKHLEQDGFLNIELEPMDDLSEKDILKKDGKVDEVSIKGDTSFESGDIFETNDIVRISYHSKKETDHTDQPDSIKVPASAKELKKLKYEEAEKRLSDAGFTDIVLEPINDIDIDILGKEGDVEAVSIRGDADFEKDDSFPSDSKVRIQYHALKDEPSPTDIPDGITVPESAKFYKKKKYQDAEKLLRDAGFTNITVTADEDLHIGLINKEDDVKSVEINGVNDFKSDQIFPKDAKIQIVYHTFAKKDTDKSKDDKNLIDKVKDKISKK